MAWETTLDHPFVETSVSRRICQTADLARELGTNAAVVGAPGIGKTAALREYERSNPRARLIVIDHVLSKSMRHLLMALIGVESHGGTGDIYSLERHFKRYDYTNHIYLIDEAQNLPLAHLRQLLHLSVEDGGQLTFVFCGNNEVLKRVNTDQGAFAQISRRVTFRENVDAITEEDADKLAGAYGAEGMDAFHMLRKVAARHHADGLVKVLGLARKLTRTATVSAEHIRTALDHLPQYRAALNDVSTRRGNTSRVLRTP